MKKGKFEKHGATRAFKLAPVAVVVALLLVGTIAGTVAYLVTRSEPKVNTFDTPNISASEEVTPDGAVITNTGDTLIYVRVAITSVTRTASGAIDASAESGAAVALNPDWFASDGYYVYKHRLAAAESVTLPFAADGATAQLATQYIQGEGTLDEVQTVVSDAWGYTVGSDYSLSN